MTVEWLEERAAWADEQRDVLTYHEVPKVAAYYADLARCARAWAKVERELQGRPGTSIDFVRGHSEVICMSFHGKATAATAIEAVEAAGGGE